MRARYKRALELFTIGLKQKEIAALMCVSITRVVQLRDKGLYRANLKLIRNPSIAMAALRMSWLCGQTLSYIDDPDIHNVWDQDDQLPGRTYRDHLV